jgi:GT2 family glycosyltransferase
MDDDTIPTSSALSEMLAARERFPLDARPDLLASKVLWSDGTVHPMNAPVVKVRDAESILLAAEHAAVSLRSISFVSVLIGRNLVKRYGLPVRDFFIWNDDAEYTARLLMDNLGVVVPASVVHHKSAAKYVAMFSAGPRYYYEVRNKIWCLLYTDAWTRREKVKIFAALCESGLAYLRCSRLSWQSLKTLFRGLRDGLFTRPIIPDGKYLGWSDGR